MKSPLYYLNGPRILRFLKRTRREHSIRAAHKAHFKEHANDYKNLDLYVENFRSSGGLNHQFQAYKLWSLNKLLEKYKPKSILEFGSGSSTLVFAEYAKKNNAKVLSIDESEKWAANTLKLIGNQNPKYVDVVAKTRKFLPEKTPKEIKYDVEIKESFDFVLVDGPSLSVDGVKYKEAVNSNIFELPELPKVIVVDVRKATALEIAEKYGTHYNIELCDLLDDEPVPKNYNLFSVYTKK